MDKETLEGNYLIALFMGYREYDNGDKRYNPKEWLTFPEEGIVYCQTKDCNYHSSWDWLMPVVMKIIYKSSSNCYFFANGYLANSSGKYGFGMLDDQINGTEALHESPILAVWEAVVKYLKSKNG